LDIEDNMVDGLFCATLTGCGPRLFLGESFGGGCDFRGRRKVKNH